MDMNMELTEFTFPTLSKHLNSKHVNYRLPLTSGSGDFACAGMDQRTQASGHLGALMLTQIVIFKTIWIARRSVVILAKSRKPKV